jgi:hypothetical protein
LTLRISNESKQDIVLLAEEEERTISQQALYMFELGLTVLQTAEARPEEQPDEAIAG